MRVLHDHDDPHALALLRAARRALPSGGHILVAEPMAGAASAERMGAAYFGFYLLAMGQGRARRPEEIGALLRGGRVRRCAAARDGDPAADRVDRRARRLTTQRTNKNVMTT